MKHTIFLPKILDTSFFLTMPRPQFIKSFVIVVYLLESEMCDMIIINY